ncbi:MAG TPA: hypothetical protein VGH52_08370 [Gaiellaceae bacterium]|jgi:hypothetical protein
MKRFLANVATITVMAGSGFAGHAVAAAQSIAAIPDPSGFGSNITEHVPYVSPEYVMTNAGATLKPVRCAVSPGKTRCFIVKR